MFILFKYFGIENSVKEYSKNIIIKFYIGYFFEQSVVSGNLVVYKNW